MANETNPPPYIQIALCLKILSQNQLISTENTLDYAAGYGTLSKIGRCYFGFEISIFDPYVTDRSIDELYLSENELNSQLFSLVMSSAFFEHVVNRESLQRKWRLLDQGGVMMILTVVCENIPDDPNWFYLEPIVHTSFFTNKSMELLMQDWQFDFSIYCPTAKSWFLFKDTNIKYDDATNIVARVNNQFQQEYLFIKRGWVDFWRGF